MNIFVLADWYAQWMRVLSDQKKNKLDMLEEVV